MLNAAHLEAPLRPGEHYQPSLRQVTDWCAVCSAEDVRRWIRSAVPGQCIRYAMGLSLPPRPAAPALILLDEARDTHLVTYKLRSILLNTPTGPARRFEMWAERLDPAKVAAHRAQMARRDDAKGRRR